MSIRARREQLKKVGFKEKKLGRLLFCQDLSTEDEYFLNYINEERQNLNFFYGIGGVGFVAMLTNFTFFRLYSFPFQLGMFGLLSLMGHAFVRRQINIRFDQRVNPYFEKYNIK